MNAVTSGQTAATALATMTMIVVVIAVGRTACWRMMTMSDRNGSVEGAETVVREMTGIWEQTRAFLQHIQKTPPLTLGGKR